MLNPPLIYNNQCKIGFKQRFLFGVPLKISLFWLYCVVHTINKRFKYMWELRNISKDKKFLYL